MRSFIATSAIALAATSLVSAAPAQLNASSKAFQVQKTNQFPNDGFPNPSDQQLKRIQQKAFGTLSDIKPPPGTRFQPDTLTSIRLIAFNEIFEAAYFQSMLTNLTTNDEYFNIDNLDKQFAINTVKSIVAVEELHAINANNALTKVAGKDAIKPCKYQFPVDNFKDAVDLAARFTDVVVGTLEDVVFLAASKGDAGFTPGVVSAVGDETEQVGWFRSINGKRPNSQPFLTRSIRDYAFSLLQDFVVPGSCDAANEGEIDLKVFQPLNAKDPKDRDQDIEFSFSLKPTRQVPSKNGYDVKNFKQQYGRNWRKLRICYLNGQNKPVCEHIKRFDLDVQSETVKLTAAFPQEDNTIFGLVLAALTVGDGFNSAQEMVDATLLGPAPLEVQEPDFNSKKSY